MGPAWQREGEEMRAAGGLKRAARAVDSQWASAQWLGGWSVSYILFCSIDFLFFSNLFISFELNLQIRSNKILKICKKNIFVLKH